jgi:hypothetical protein
MRHSSRHFRILLLAALLLLLATFAAAPVYAQFEFEDEPVAGEGAAAAEPAAAPAVNAADTAALNALADGDPVIAAVLDLPRTTPVEQFEVIATLVELRRGDVAALLIPRFLASELDDAERAALVRQFGSARFMKLIRLDGPTPEGEPAGDLAGMRAFAQACLDAAAAEATDPARLEQLVAGLSAPTEEERYAARVDLRATGDPGMIAAMHALTVAKTPEARGHVMAALAEMRPAIDAPLIAVLADGRGQVRADAATLAGRMRMRAALPWLTALAVSPDVAAPAATSALVSLGLAPPTPAEARALIEDEVANLESMPVDSEGDLQNAWWTFDSQAGQLTATAFNARQRRTLERARWARALAMAGALADPASRRRIVLDALEEAELLGRASAPEVAQQLTAMSPADLSATLAAAMEADRPLAAVQIATTLGARNDAAVLSSPDGRPSPLATALKHRDRDLRFAALQAIMQLDPQHTFPGASYVPKALWYFAAGAGESAAVVAAPNFPLATSWAGQLRGVGLDATPTSSGKAAIFTADDPAIAPRLAVIVLDSDIDKPTVREVAYQLHSADRTAAVPILIAASVEHYAAAQDIADHDPLVLATPRPTDDAALASAVERTVALSARPLADPARRTEQAAMALEWLAKLLAADAPYDELRREGALVQRSLFVKELVEPSIRVLAVLGTVDSQTALVDYASARTLPIETRRGAAEALAANFRRYGIQLTRAQVLAQYDRYNASETADADTQAVLGSILDLIEKKK